MKLVHILDFSRHKKHKNFFRKIPYREILIKVAISKAIKDEALLRKS